MVSLCRAARVGGQDAVPRLFLHSSARHARRLCGIRVYMEFVRAPRRKNPYHRFWCVGACVLLRPRRSPRRAWPPCDCSARRFPAAWLESLSSLLHRDSEDLRACVAFCGNWLLPPDICPTADSPRGHLRVCVGAFACFRVRHAHQSRRDSCSCRLWAASLGSHLVQDFPLVWARRRVWSRGRLRFFPLRPYGAHRPIRGTGLPRRPTTPPAAASTLSLRSDPCRGSSGGICQSSSCLVLVLRTVARLAASQISSSLCALRLQASLPYFSSRCSRRSPTRTTKFP